MGSTRVNFARPICVNESMLKGPLKPRNLLSSAITTTSDTSEKRILPAKSPPRSKEIDTPEDSRIPNFFSVSRSFSSKRDVSIA